MWWGDRGGTRDPSECCRACLPSRMPPAPCMSFWAAVFSIRHFSCATRSHRANSRGTVHRGPRCGRRRHSRGLCWGACRRRPHPHPHSHPRVPRAVLAGGRGLRGLGGAAVTPSHQGPVCVQAGGGRAGRQRRPLLGGVRAGLAHLDRPCAVGRVCAWGPAPARAHGLRLCWREGLRARAWACCIAAAPALACLLCWLPPGPRAMSTPTRPPTTPPPWLPQGWDYHFIPQGAHVSYHTLKCMGLKTSPRDAVVAKFCQDALYVARHRLLLGARERSTPRDHRPASTLCGACSPRCDFQAPASPPWQRPGLCSALVRPCV